MPTYIARPHDESLREAVSSARRGTSSMAVLVGESSTGKTRACWEAVKSLPAPWRLWHPIDPDRPEALLSVLDSGIPPHTVLWLNEIQFYLLPSTGERIAAGLRELLRTPTSGPVLVLGTTWPDHWWRLTRQPPPNEPDAHAQARQLLDGTDISVPDRFDEKAMRALRAASEGDPRLATAEDAHGKVVQFLSGAPKLMERYRNAPRPAKAVLDAAVDLRRFDYPTPIPEELLRQAAASYFPPDDFDTLPDDWFERALEVVCSPARGLPGPLTRVRRRPGAAEEGPVKFRVADYLEQQVGEERKNSFPPEAVFRAIHALTDEPERLHVVASRLGNLWRDRMAAFLHHRALTLGHWQSARPLAELLELAGDLPGATSVLEAAPHRDDLAVDQLMRLLVQQERFDRVEELAEEEFKAGAARALLAALEGVESPEAMREYEAITTRVLFPSGASEEQIQANAQVFHNGIEDGNARRREYLRLLSELAESDDPALDAQRAAVRDLDSRVLACEQADDPESAHEILIEALGVEAIDIDRVVGFYERRGLSAEAKAVHRFGVDDRGLPARSFDLGLLHAGW
ncbi:hypothetical protein [Amycolatopsis sp. NPDC049159]|uniref:hypothetical protein n=1 Tax=Amycolatopsis sp. NPDC049159 TaxID=3157210 RepID=UPI00340CE6E7